MILNHTHKYERRKLGSWKTHGHEVYKCAVSGCGHYMPDMEMIVGRYSACWGTPDGKECDNEVEMTRYLVFNEKRKRPLCQTCKDNRKKQRMSVSEKEQMDARMRTIERLLEEV